MPELWGEGGWGPGFWGAGDSPLVFDELTNYYIDLLIIQYRSKDKARNTVGSLMKQLIAEHIIEGVNEAFDLETAVGVQLDVLAAYRGANRIVYGLDLTRDYFAMPYYDDTPEDYVGFAEYGDVVTWYWLLYSSGDQPVYAMTDDELRRLTKFRAKTQSRYLSNREIDEIMWEFFGANVNMIDNMDMTVDYDHDPSDPDTLFGIVEGTNSLPRPAGVTVTVI